MQRFALFAVGILICTARREEGKDQRDLRLEGSGGAGDPDAICADNDFQTAVDRFHELIKRNEEDKVILSDATQLFTLGQQALTKIRAEHEKLITTKKSVELRKIEIEKTILEQEKTVEVEKKRQPNLEFLVKLIGSIPEPFMKLSDRLAIGGIYLGCTAMSDDEDDEDTGGEKGGLSKLIEAAVIKLNAVYEKKQNVNSFRQFSKHEFLSACFKISVDVLKKDGKFESGDADEENKFISAVEAQTIEDVLKGSPELFSQLDTYQCYAICESFAVKVNTAEDVLFSSTTLAIAYTRRKKISTELVEVETTIERVTNMLKGCEAGLAAIELDVTELATRTQLHDSALRKQSNLEKKRRLFIATQGNKKKQLFDTNTKITSLSKQCKETDSTIKNMTCRFNDIDKSIVSQLHKVEAINDKLQDEERIKNQLEDASQAYAETKMTLYTLLKMWYTMFYKQMLTIQQITKITMIEGMHEKHSNFVSKCRKTEEAFQAINDVENHHLPTILTDMQDSIESKAEEDDDETAKQLSNHLEASFSFYAGEFIDKMIKEEENTGVIEQSYDDSQFQRLLVKFMSYCPQRGKSFCSSYLIGWFDKTNCENNAKCGNPCIMTDKTCQAPNGAGNYLLELKIKMIYERQLAALTTIQTQLKEETTALEQLKTQLKALLDELDKHKTSHKECKEEVKKLETNTLAVLQGELSDIGKELQVIENKLTAARSAMGEHEKEGLMRMKQIKIVTQGMKDNKLDAKAAIEQITEITRTFESKSETMTRTKTMTSNKLK